MNLAEKVHETIVRLQAIEAELTGHDTPTAPPGDTPYSKVFRNARVVRVVEYADGWVPNSRKDVTVSTCRVYNRDGSCKEETYDPHRLRGQGPHWRAYSKRGKLIAEG